MEHNIHNFRITLLVFVLTLDFVLCIQWIGMGNQELLDYFSIYDAMRARHSYGPQGHRGMSVLIFEASASGYLEAERLHKHFAEQGTDKDSWFSRPILYLPGGNRQLYGYMATKEDLDFFNRHSQGSISSFLVTFIHICIMQIV